MKFKAGDKVKVKHFNKIPGYWNVKMHHLMGKVVDVVLAFPDGGVIIYDDVNDNTWALKKDDVEPVNDERIVICRHNRKVIAKDLNTGKTGVARCNPSDKFDFYTGAKLAFERLTGEEKKKVKFSTGMAIWCENKSQYDELMKILEGAGYKWKSHHIPTEYKPPYVHYGVLVCTYKDMTIGCCSYSGSFDNKVKFSDVDFSECEKKTLNIKICVVSSASGSFTRGKIYEIVDGRITADNGHVFPTHFKFTSADELRDYFSSSKNWQHISQGHFSPAGVEFVEVVE